MKKEPQHPYDKFVAIRGEIEEAAVGRKALIRAIADFIKLVLPENILAQKVVLPKSVSSAQTAQTPSPPPPPQRAPVALSSTSDYVFQTETSPVSTRIIGAAAADDDGDEDYGVAGAVGEGDVHAFSRKSFGEIASPYLAPSVHKKGLLDAEYGLRKVGNRFFMGNCDVVVDSNIEVCIRDMHSKGTRGHWEQLTRKRVDTTPISEDDLE